MAKKIKVRKSGSHKSHKNHSVSSPEKSKKSDNSQTNIWMVIAIISIVLNLILAYFIVIPNKANKPDLSFEEELEQTIAQLSGLIQNSELDEKTTLNSKLDEIKNILYNYDGEDNSTHENNETQGEIKLIVLNDERCVECEIDPLIMQLEQMLGKLNVTKYDYSSVEGKGLYETFELDLLPVLLFDKAVEKSENYAQVQPYMETYGDYLSLRFGAFFDPTKEICDNNVDDTGNGLVDCEDPDCNETLLCNPEIIADCVSEFNITKDTVLFVASETCPWCALMKPGVESLMEEGYNAKTLMGSEEAQTIINACLLDYMSGSVPEFICPANGEIKTGAFTDANRELNLDAMRNWFDSCVNAASDSNTTTN
jgi:hypothetical protein